MSTKETELKEAFIYRDDKSAKFWRVQTLEGALVVNYGKEGAIGKYQIKDFDSSEECQKEAKKLIAQKQKKGYISFSFDYNNHSYLDDEEWGVNRLTTHPKFINHFLNDFYYDICDEEAPFGSDEGNDCLATLEMAFMEKRTMSFLDFPKKLIEKDWGMKYIEVQSLDEKEVQKVAENHEMDMIQSDMITYATAFAQIKITGKIDANLKEDAIKSMKRLSIFYKSKYDSESEITSQMIADLTAFQIEE